MLAVRYEGITHERMGVVDDVTVIGSQAHCAGSTQDTQIEYPEIETIIIDRTGRTKDQVLPRLDFLDRDGEVVISATALDGPEPFDAALESLGAVVPMPEPKRGPTPQTTVTDSDPGTLPLAAASRTRIPIAIEMHRPAVVQRWRGVVEEVVAAMGFISVMEPDFHLHVRGGSVTHWGRRAVPPLVELAAAGADGTALGLVLVGDASAFGDDGDD
jgi:putative heme degradation protein